MKDRFERFEKANNTFLQSISKKFSNSIYSGCERRDIEESNYCVTQRWMKDENDESVKERFLLEIDNFMVRIKDRDFVDDEIHF